MAARLLPLALMLLLAAFASGCAQAPPNTFPFPENLWVDAENHIRTNKDVEYRIGPITRLERSRIETVPNSRKRVYYFLVQAAKGSGEITVEYRYSSGVWEVHRWDYSMGFPPPERGAGGRP